MVFKDKQQLYGNLQKQGGSYNKMEIVEKHLGIFLLIMLLFLSGSKVIAAEITSVVVSDQSNSQQTNLPFTFGHGFKQGDVPANSSLSAKLGSGTSVPLQVDKKATYSDGSLRHAVLTAKLSRLAANADETLTLFTKANGPSTAGISFNTLKASAFDAKVDFVLSWQVPDPAVTNHDLGKTITKSAPYSISAKDVIQNTQTPRVWLSGPLVTEWIIGGPVKETSTGRPHEHLMAYFHIRAYTGANTGTIDRIRVDVVVENNWLYVPNPVNLTYTATISIPGQPMWEYIETIEKKDANGDPIKDSNGDPIIVIKKTIENYHHARWHKRFWWNKTSNVYVKQNAAYLQSTPMVPKYEALTPSEAYLDGLISSVLPGKIGNLRVNMPDTGYSPTIGPIPNWVAAYVITTDRRAYEATLANADAGGSYSAHYRDKNTGYPASIADHPKASTKGNARNIAKPVGKDRYIADTAHMPSIAYVPYLITGDYYYLEELHFWVTYALLNIPPGDANILYRGGAKGYVYSGQARAQAWSLREIARAAFITPDTHPQKQHYNNVINNNMDWYNSKYTNNPTANQLGILVNGDAYSSNYQDRSGIAPWQHDYFTWTIGHLVELGFVGAKTFFPWISKFALQRMTGEPSYCWNAALKYMLLTRNDKTSPTYASMGTVFEKNFPNLVGLTCNSQAMMDALKGTEGVATYTINSMTGRSDSVTSYYKFLQPALAMIVDFAPNKELAKLAWSRHQNNPTPPPMAKRNDTPIYAVVPRSSQVVAQPGDTDGDGLPDQWEKNYFGDLTTSDGWSDGDNDGLKDADELKYQTDPTNDDTDSDGYKDGAEVKWGADPTSGSDTKLQHQPNQPQLADGGAQIPVYGFFFEISNYTDPDSDLLLETQWQISEDDQFTNLVFNRRVKGQNASLVVPPGVLTPNKTYFVRSAYIDETTLQGAWSTPISITTQNSYPNDTDGNIVDDTFQPQFSAIDTVQNQTCTLMDAQSNSPIKLAVSNGSIVCFTSYDTSIIDANSVPYEGLPYGLISFSVNNVNPDSPVIVTVEFPETVDANSAWYQYDMINGLLNKFQTVQYAGNTVMLTLQDAGEGDIDGVSNDAIVSSGGIGGNYTTPTPDTAISNSDTKDSGAGAINFVLWLILLMAISIRYRSKLHDL